MIPRPTGPDWKTWATALVKHFEGLTANRAPTEPRPLQLAHLQSGEAATTDGILMWNPTTQKVQVSKSGAWVDV